RPPRHPGGGLRRPLRPRPRPRGGPGGSRRHPPPEPAVRDGARGRHGDQRGAGDLRARLGRGAHRRSGGGDRGRLRGPQRRAQRVDGTARLTAGRGRCPGSVGKGVPKMISVNNLRTGLTIEVDGELWTVLEFLHVKPGKGQAFVRTKLRNVRTGNVIDRTFKAGERVEQARVDKRTLQYLYRDG